MSLGKFFFIQSHLNDMVLDIDQGVMESGTPVTTWERNDEDNQLWFMDYIKDVIRSKADDNFVLELQGDALVISEYNPDVADQTFARNGLTLQLYDTPEQVLEVLDADTEKDAPVGPREYTGEDHQLWTFVYIQPMLCNIRSLAKNNKVMDVKGNDDEEDAPLVLHSQKDSDEGQIFYEDKNGFIRSQMTDFVFDTFDSECVRMREFEADVNSQRWVKSGNKIVHKDDPNLCMQVKDCGTFHTDRVEVGEFTGDKTQRWMFEYFE